MNRRSAVLGFLGRMEGLPVAAVLIVLYIVFILTAPRVFLAWPIYASFLQTVPKVLICGLGLTFVITAGEIDLSFPAVVAFSGFIFAWFYRNVDAAWAPWVGFFLALAAGGLVGFINGLLVARVGVPSIMATLASQFFWYGVTVLLAGGLNWTLSGVRDTVMFDIFAGRLFGAIPMQAIWTLALAIFLWFLLNRHTFGESILFIGDNPDVARVMGINVEMAKIKLFTMMGILAAFSALIVTIDIGVFYPTQGEGFLLPALAGVFIGGTSIAGGQGSIVGTFFGSYIIGSLEAGVVASGISGYWVHLVEGAVMAASVTLNLIIGEGRMAGLSRRLRQWGIPVGTGRGTEPPVELPQRDSAASK